jgi:hypothetical protein
MLRGLVEVAMARCRRPLAGTSTKLENIEHYLRVLQRLLLAYSGFLQQILPLLW